VIGGRSALAGRPPRPARWRGGEDGESRERGAAARSQGIACCRCCSSVASRAAAPLAARFLPHSPGHFGQASLEVVEGGGERRELLLQQRRAEKGVVDLLPEREQRGADARLRLGEIGAGEIPARLNRRVVEPLVDAQRGVVGELGPRNAGCPSGRVNGAVAASDA